MGLLMQLPGLLALTSAVAGANIDPSVQSPCDASAFTHPNVFGAEVLDLSVYKLTNQTTTGQFVATYPPQAYTVSGCGLDMALAGGGWAAGYGAVGLAPAVANGFAAATTDAGHSITNPTPASWALDSPGNVNFELLQDFTAVAFSDLTLFGQAITTQYYGRAPSYSYWTGCSTGGRQGLMLAQRYPTLYDGILAQAPAINWENFIVAEFWAQQIMYNLGYFPRQCELEAFRSAAIEACDGLDGVEDGVITDDDRCQFDPHSLVGQTFSCNTSNVITQRTYTEDGARAIAALWTGPVDALGKRQWYGLNRDAAISGLAGTTTSPNGTTTAAPFPIAEDWIKYFIAKDPSFVVSNLTEDEYFDILRQARNQYTSIIGTSDPDLSPFKANGGKMITWHGLADQLIFPNGTRQYYQEVSATVSGVQDFYRFFEAPGVGHCGGRVGYQPVGQLEALVDWVEQGVAPDILRTVNTTQPGAARDICAYPKQQVYVGGDPSEAKSFVCR